MNSYFLIGDRSFFVFFFFFLFYSANAQTNLVYNGDFELYDTCPTLTSTPGDYQIEHCLGWKSPTYATSDYFNSCAISVVDVPLNNLGYQFPYSGNAYCGIANVFTAPPTATYGYWFEYIQGNLTAPLKSGCEYAFSCRIVLSDVLVDYAFWKFGAAFTPNAISKVDGKPFTGITPQVMNQTNNFITDTLNWVEIKGKFFAQGGEQYITLGFFSDTTALDTLRYYTFYPVDSTNFGNYYYIDAVSVIETSIAVPNVFTPNGNGLNDVFSIAGLTKDDRVIIYNRWGTKVYEFEGPNDAWDGRNTSGEACSEGVYYYIVIRKEKESIKGFVQLLR